MLLTGAGRAFSAGGDFAWFPELQEPGRLEQLRLDAKALIWDLLDVPLPIVCALNGHAVGLGASIALLCDAVFMASSATIADPHVRVGIVAGDGGTVAWPLAVGPMRGQALPAHRRPGAPRTTPRRSASSPRPCPTTRCSQRASAFAHRLAAGAPLAVQGTKQAVNALVKRRARALVRPRHRARDRHVPLRRPRRGARRAGREAADRSSGGGDGSAAPDVGLRRESAPGRPGGRPGVFAAAVVLGVPSISVLGRDQWFVNDEWHFIVDRDGGSLAQPAGAAQRALVDDPGAGVPACCGTCSASTTTPRTRR